MLKKHDECGLTVFWFRESGSLSELHKKRAAHAKGKKEIKHAREHGCSSFVNDFPYIIQLQWWFVNSYLRKKHFFENDLGISMFQIAV